MAIGEESKKLSFDPEPRLALDFEVDRHRLIGHLEELTIGAVSLDANLELKEPLVRSVRQVVGVIDLVEWPGGPENVLTLSAWVNNVNRRKILEVLHNKAVPEITCAVKFTVYDYDFDKKKWFKAFHTNMRPIDGNIGSREGGVTGSPSASAATITCGACGKTLDASTGSVVTVAEEAPAPQLTDRERILEEKLKESERQLAEIKARADAAASGNRVTLRLAVESKEASVSPRLWKMTAEISPGSTVQSIHFATGSTSPIVKDWGVAT